MPGGVHTGAPPESPEAPFPAPNGTGGRTPETTLARLASAMIEACVDAILNNATSAFSMFTCILMATFKSSSPAVT